MFLFKESSMTSFARAACAAAGLLGILIAVPVLAADGPGVEPKAAFARLKSLAGEWTVDAKDHGHAAPGASMKIVYKVTSSGSVVMETYFPGTDHEMVSMYHMDGGDLRMTHYCAVGNQPKLKLDTKASTPDQLVFAFEGGTNLDPAKDMHMHSGKISFRDGRVETAWDGYKDGKKTGTHTFVLSKP
jgi:hypothetical protein